LNFIKDIRKRKSNLLDTYIEAQNWVENEKEFRENIDEIIFKENKRRNIFLKEDLDGKIYNFDNTIDFTDLLFQKKSIKPSLKSPKKIKILSNSTLSNLTLNQNFEENENHIHFFSSSEEFSDGLNFNLFSLEKR